MYQTVSSQSSDVFGEKAKERERCLQNGGEWLDNQCVERPNSSTSSSSSSSADDSEVQIEEKYVVLVKNLTNRTMRIDGYFVHYGPKKFDWVYIDYLNKKAFKLNGYDEEEQSILWVEIDDYFSDIEIEPTSVSFGKLVKYSGDMREVAVILSGRSFNVDGYFLHVGSDRFDWIYIVAQNNNVFKLDGYQESGFVWADMSAYFSEVERRGDEIYFGPLKISTQSDKTKSSTSTQSSSKQNEVAVSSTGSSSSRPSSENVNQNSYDAFPPEL
jgi:hypothetical protein